MPAGAPSKYEPIFCEIAIELGRAGKSVTHIAAEIGVAKQTVYNWMQEHPEFLDAVTRAITFAEAVWMDKGEDYLVTGQGVTFNAQNYKLQMQNRFDWREKKDQTVDARVSTQESALDELAKEPEYGR